MFGRETREDGEAQQEQSQRQWQERTSEQKQQKQNRKEQTQQTKQDTKQEDRKASIRAKSAELSQPFDSEIRTRWVKIQAMNDILNGLEKTDNEMEPKRGGHHCGWQYCPDRQCETSFEDGLIERGYSQRAVIRMKMLEQRDIHWQKIEQVEWSRVNMWEREIRAK